MFLKIKRFGGILNF